jgi:hypothetical protein
MPEHSTTYEYLHKTYHHVMEKENEGALIYIYLIFSFCALHSSHLISLCVCVFLCLDSFPS